MDIPILYQDQDLVVINKRSGLLVHRSLIDKGAREFAVQILRDQLQQPVFPVHRLDRATSGALLFALSKDSARELSRQFECGQVEKKYLAIVRGQLKDSVLVDHALQEELDKKTDAKAKTNKPAQDAITEIRPLLQCELPVAVDRYPTSRYSLIEALPKTGRKHQIRRHLKHLKHPIIGDSNYGHGKHNRFFSERLGNQRLLLACTELSFAHPKTGATMTVQAPLAPEFVEVMGKLGWGSYGK